MKKKLLIAFLLLQSISFFAQNIEANRDKIKQAQTELAQSLSEYFSNIATTDLDTLFNQLITSKAYHAENEFHNYLIGGILFNIDATQSYEYHEKAYNARPNDENFILEYALELHRKQEFAKAAELYEKYMLNKVEDKRINALLADCYMNTGDTQKAIDCWNKADHAKNHTSIDFAINIVYGNNDQFRIRNTIRNEIKQNNFKRMDDLIFMDSNWATDWYNSGVNKRFLDEDIDFIKNQLGENNEDYLILKAYMSVKEERDGGKITKILKDNSLLIDNGKLPKFGNIASNLLKICFQKGVLTEKEFYTTRGEALLNQASETHNIELLNVYAYLQAEVDGKVKPEIDKLGWKTFKDERFAVSYFLGQDAETSCAGTEVAEAIRDFPSSSKLYWFSAYCAGEKGEKMKPYLIELIKKEFKTLKSDPSRYSYKLKGYFGLLEQEK